MDSWKVKKWEFETTDQAVKRKADADSWIFKHRNKYQIRGIFIRNAWAVEYRPLAKG